MNRLNTPRTRAFAVALARQGLRRAANATQLGDIAPELVDAVLGNPERERLADFERRLTAIEKKLGGIF